MDELYRKVPLMLTATLYDYNYIDSKIIAALRNSCYILRKEKNRILVPAEDLLNVLKSQFGEDIDTTASYPQDRLIHGMNTAFQLFHLLSYYTSLKAVGINISKDRNYSKVMDVGDGTRLIGLDYKIDKAFLRYDEEFSVKDLKLLNSMLRDIGVIKTIRPYSSYSVYAAEYIRAIDELDPDSKKKYKTLISYTNEALLDKIEMDNPLLTIVTDHLK
jgi:hypothetical protein